MWKLFSTISQTKVKQVRKYANWICYLVTLVLRDHSKWWAAKNEHEEGDSAHLNFCSNSNNERKILTHHEIIDCITEKIESVIAQMCKESKLWIHPNLRWPGFSLTFISVHLLLCCRYMDLKNGISLKKIRNHSQPLKLQHKNLSQMYLTGRL